MYDNIYGDLLKNIISRFLLVFLSIETILQEVTVYRRREKLWAMKKGLDLGEAYTALVGRIKAEGGEKARLGMAVLMWISHSRRPLLVDELCHAIAIRIGSDDLDSDDIPTISTLLDCCQGLITVDKRVSTVRLIHFTLQEHLCTHPNPFDAAHSTMAETCLTYLHFQHVKDLPAGLPPDLRDTPFIEYASLYWGAHMRIELSDRAVIFALQLLDQFNCHISAKSLWQSIIDGPPSCYDSSYYYSHYSVDTPFSALHCISYFGIPEVTITLLKMNRWDVNQRDFLGMTPLIWAARYGNEEVVRLLLREKHIQPDQQDAQNRRTALSWAAGNGHEGVVRLFLGRQFVNRGSMSGRWGKAARAMSHLFGQRYVNPDSSCKYGQTPLSWAAEKGHEGIVKLLLGQKYVNPNTVDTLNGRTPLSWAAGNGHEGIVKLLLGRKDVNPDTPATERGRTPLSWAAIKGHEGIVKLLLERKDVYPNIRDRMYGRTPLSWAAENGHEGIVKLLFGQKDVIPDTPDTLYGQTPLCLAAEKGHEGILRLLMERNDVIPDTPDTRYGQTPLSWAAGSGHEGIVKLLLGRKDVNPDTPDRADGQTPLSLAAENGHEKIVKLLLGRKDVYPDTPDTKYGRTPLSWSAENGHERIVTLLLGRKDVNPDTPDTEYGRTPLSWAAQNGHDGIVKLLLGRNDVNPNSSSKSGETPRMRATRYGHKSVAELLQARHP